MKRYSFFGIIGTVGALLLASCSSPTHQPSASPVPHWSKAQVSEWATSAVALVGTCESTAQELDDALHAEPVSSVDLTRAAGDAFASCSENLQSSSSMELARTMSSQFPAGTALLQSWLDSLAAISNMVLEDSFGSSVAPQSDSALAQAQQRSNQVADQFEGLILKIASSLGVTFPEEHLLYRWKTPPA